MAISLLVALLGLLCAVVLGGYLSSQMTSQRASLTAVDRFRPYQ